MKIGNKEFIEEYDKQSIYTILLINNSDISHKFPGNVNYCHTKHLILIKTLFLILKVLFPMHI